MLTRSRAGKYYQTRLWITLGSSLPPNARARNGAIGSTRVQASQGSAARSLGMKMIPFFDCL